MFGLPHLFPFSFIRLHPHSSHPYPSSSSSLSRRAARRLKYTHSAWLVWCVCRRAERGCVMRHEKRGRWRTIDSISVKCGHRSESHTNWHSTQTHTNPSSDCTQRTLSFDYCLQRHVSTMFCGGVSDRCHTGKSTALDDICQAKWWQ